MVSRPITGSANRKAAGDRLPDLELVEGRLGHVHRRISGLQPIAHDEQILRGRIGKHARKLRRRYAVAHHIHLAVLEAQHRTGIGMRVGCVRAG
jgi:hypothetical protein